ncbi:MAG: T9SS type A sorting domain-containing protein, partial [Taibaiella sp.]|nr:T9SS type A sorting domain-containing protein [Taibaiella sp.]
MIAFGAVRVLPVSGSTTSLTVTVPVGAIMGPVTVTDSATGLSGYSGQSAGSPIAAFLPVFDTTGFVIDTVNLRGKTDFTVTTGAGSRPYGAAIGDLNGDGKPDMVSYNVDSSSVTVLVNTSTGGVINSGSFTLGTKIGLAGKPNNVKLADIDGDGKLDIVAALSNNTTINIVRNITSSPTVTFATRTSITVGTVSAVAAIADFNGDGRADIALSLPAVGVVGVLRNTSTIGSISFAGVVTATAGAAPSGIIAADLDGDGKADLATVNSGFTGSSYTGNTATAFLSTSAGAAISFGTGITLSTGSGPIDLAAGDVTNDGKADLLVTNINDNTFSVLANTSTTGSISFASRVNFATGTGATGINVADMNGDGRADVVVSNGLANTISVFRNTATGSTPSFAASVDRATAATPTTVTIGDLDGDTYADVVVGNQGTNTISVFENYPLPKVAPVTGTTAYCTGGTGTLTNSTSGGSWSVSNSTVASISSGGVVTALVAGTDTVYYTKIINGDTASTFAVLTVNTTPVVGVSAGAAIICNGSNTALTASGASTYSWSPAASLSASTGASVTATPTITTTYTVTGTTAGGCTDTATQTITVAPGVSAAITSAPVPCSGYSVNVVIGGTSGDTITYSVDGGSYITGVIASGIFNIATGAITAPHTYLLHTVRNAACVATIDTSVIISPVVLTWQGSTSTNWNATANWNCGVVPTATDNVLIPSGTTFAPAIAASATGVANNITIASGVTVTLAALAELGIKGTLSNNATVTGAGKLSLTGTSAQTISGTGSVSNFNLDNSAGATVATGAKLIIKSTLAVTTGTLNTGDSVVLYSDSTTTARGAQLPSGSVISGNVKVMQYVQGGLRRFRFWSHPFDSYIGLSQAQNYIDITGVGGAANGFTPTATNAASAFRYNPMVGNSSLASDPGWRPFTSTFITADSNRLHRYQGIRLFFRGDKGQGLGYITAYTPLPVTVSQWGSLNQGNQTVVMAKGSSASQDYNVLGNPYASPVDIGTVIFNARAAGNVIGASFFVWNPYLGSAGQYQAIPIDSFVATPYYIQANSSFTLRTAHNNDTLNFTEAHKGATATASLLKAIPGYVSLMVYDGNYHPWDMLHVRFNDAASDSEDRMADATKPSGADFNFYSLSADNQKLAIDSRPYGADKVIPLGISSGYAQDFIIKAENVTLPTGGSLYLHDKLLKQYIAMSQGAEYRFSVTKDKATQGEQRFELSMSPIAIAGNSKGLEVNMIPNPATEDVSVTFSNSRKAAVSIRILDLSGVSVYNRNLGTQQSGGVKVSLGTLASGIYMVELTAGNEKVVQRLVKE